MNIFKTGVLTKTFTVEDIVDQDGEVVEAAGYTKTVRFFLNMSAIDTIEKETGRGIIEIYARLSQGVITMGELITIYFAALQRYQPDVTRDEAAEVMDALPEVWVELFAAALPKAEPEKAKNRKKPAARNPTKKVITRA